MPVYVLIAVAAMYCTGVPDPVQGSRSPKMRGAVASSTACTPRADGLHMIATDPERPHLVSAEGVTTFILGLSNPSAQPRLAHVTIASTNGWVAKLAEADDLFQPTSERMTAIDVTLPVTQTIYLSVSLRPSQHVQVGTEGKAEIRAVSDAQNLGCVVVHGRVSNQAKMYFFGIDGLGPSYLALDRRGQINPDPATLLMPNAVNFLDDAAHLVNANASLPASTDPNILSALTGSWPGTIGIPYVGVFFTKLTPAGELKVSGPSHDYLRWGSSGKPIVTIFDQAKDASVGGNADAFLALITGKSWINELFRDEQGTVDILADGKTHPSYFSVPLPYKLGDPISDDDRDEDRDGTNLDPGNYKMILESYNVGYDPVTYPEDRWIAENALRTLAAEDPDVMFVHLAGVDEASHAAGAADRPEEWFNPDDTERLWDDSNVFNAHANRETALDVVHEADACFGLLRNALQRKGTLEQSIMVLFSDHSFVTYVDDEVNIEAILEGANLAGSVTAGSWGEMSSMFLTDSTLVPSVERALENYTLYHPVLKRDVRPFVVVTRAEMATGIDNVLGKIAASTESGRAELYSEWSIDHPVDDATKVRWPDLFVFTGYRLQLKGSKGTSLPHPIGGHGGLTTKQVVLGIKGPGIATGTFPTRASLADIAPTLYRSLGWSFPAHVDGRVLNEILRVIYLPQVINKK